MLDVIIDFLKSNISNIISIFAMLSAYMFILKPKMFFRSAYLGIYREQLDKVYYPMYKTLKPYMFQSISPDLIKELTQKLLKIANDNYILMDFNLLNAIEILERNSDETSLQSEFIELCELVCQLFDRTRNYLGLPPRTYSYKLNNHQYKSIPIMVIGFILRLLCHMIILFIGYILVMLFILRILTA